MSIKISVPVTRETAGKLRAGDIVEISGTIYTARDAAHKRMLEEYDRAYDELQNGLILSENNRAGTYRNDRKRCEKRRGYRFHEKI